MGNLFSGAVEDFLLYGATPVALLVVLAALLVAEMQVRQRLRQHERGWLAFVVPTDAALFRAQGVQPGSAPREVLVLIRVLHLWAVGTGIFWCGLALLFVFGHWWWVALLLFGLGITASAHMIRGARALCDRNDHEARPTVARARLWLFVHHGAVFVIGTGLLALFALSNQFFWNGATDHRVGQLIEFGVLYAIVVLVPTALGALLAQRLRRVASYYPDEATPTAADPIPS